MSNQPFRVPRFNRCQRQGVKCPPQGALGQALPKGKPCHLIITQHPDTENPMALEIRNQRATQHPMVPVRCQPQLGAGTILAGTKTTINKSVFYVFHDVLQYSGRWLRDVSHRERLGILVGTLRSIDCNGAGIDGWPRFALATLLSKCDGSSVPVMPSIKELGYAVREVIYRVPAETNTMYIVGEETERPPERLIKMSSKQEEDKERKMQQDKRQGKEQDKEKNKPQDMTRRNSNGSNGNAGSSTNSTHGTKEPKSSVHEDNNRPKMSKCHVVCQIIAGKAGPDDYSAQDQTGNKLAPLCVRSLDLSLKLNQLLRGQHYDLYRPPGTVRVLPKVSLPCVWEAKHQRWTPVVGTNANTTYPVCTS